MKSKHQDIANMSSLNEAPGDVAGADSDIFSDATFAEHAEFLFHIAFLPLIFPHSAEAISGRCDAVRILEQLSQEHIFCERAGALNTAYVLRREIRDFLMRGATARFTDKKIQELRLLATNLLERDRLIKEAFDLNAQAEDWDAAIAVVQRNGGRLHGQRCAPELLTLLQSLPAEQCAASADCQYWLGQSLPMSNLQEKLAAFEQAIARYEQAGQAPEMVRCMAAVILILCLPGLSDAPLVREWLQRLRQLLDAGDEFTDEIKLIGYTALVRAMLFKEFSDLDLQEWVAQLAKLLETVEDNEEKVIAATMLLRFYFYFGFIERTKHLIAQVESIVEALPLAPMTAIWWHIGCGQYYYAIAGQTPLALEIFDKAQKIADEHECNFIEHFIIIHRVFATLGEADAAAAGNLLQRLELLRPSYSPLEKLLYKLALASHALHRKNPIEALPHAKEAYRISNGLMMPVFQAIATYSLASTLVAYGDFGKAEILLKSLQRDDQFCYGDYLYPHVRLLDAELTKRKGHYTDSVEKLRSAFFIAKEAQSLTKIFWLPNVMSDLCTRALEHGVQMDFVTSVIETHSLRPLIEHKAEAWPWPVRIYALGSFSIFTNGEELLFSGKTQRKPLELLKVLVALGGENIDGMILTHLLWPEADGDAGQRSFHSTLHRLRKLIGCEDAVTMTDRKVSLNPSLCWVDVWEFERLVESYPRPGATQAGSMSPFEQSQIVNRVLAVYRSDFLVLDEIQAWIMPKRDKLRSKFLRFISEVGDSLEQSEKSGEAVALYERGLEVDCLAEELYRRLMLCRRQRGETAAAIRAYDRCREVLSIILGIAPSEKTTTLYRELVASNQV